MSMKLILIAPALALGLSGADALAQDGDADDLDVTITLMAEDAEESDAVTRTLELPTNDEGEYIPSDQGVDNSAKGLETANAAREDGRAFGEATAAAAQESRENLGRGERPNLEDLVPDHVPNVPELPETPSPPGP